MRNACALGEKLNQGSLRSLLSESLNLFCIFVIIEDIYISSIHKTEGIILWPANIYESLIINVLNQRHSLLLNFSPSLSSLHLGNLCEIN